MKKRRRWIAKNRRAGHPLPSVPGKPKPDYGLQQLMRECRAGRRRAEDEWARRRGQMIKRVGDDGYVSYLFMGAPHPPQMFPLEDIEWQ